MEFPNPAGTLPADPEPEVVTYGLSWEEDDAADFGVHDAGGKRTRRIADDPFWEVEVAPELVVKVQAIRRQLVVRGWTPAIPRGSAWRSPSEQMRKVLQGHSKTLRSRHSVVGRDGRRAARAVDIVPAYYGWDAPRPFWLLLGRLAEREGLRWGGFFGLSAAEAARLRHLLARENTAGAYAPIRLGWDTAHVELV